MPWKHISLARLEMTNFKRFYGHHTLDLLSEPEIGKPLVLIGGDNGRGKTSIHEAINYALYEDDDLPGIHTRPSYLRAVSDRLNHRALDEGRNDYGVAVELLANSSGAERCIRIEREWTVNVAQRCVTEPNLKVSENGRPIDFIHDSTYQDFLRSLLPPRIAPFFIFDGERIQEFAEDENHERRMIEAIEDILHITVYKLLRDDLKKYVIDHIDKTEIAAHSSDDFFQLRSDKERIESEIEAKQDRLADIERETEELGREQKRVDEELRRIASPHASQRDELIAEQQRLSQEMEQAKGEMQEGFEPLPLLLSGALRTELREALEKEQRGMSTAQGIEKLRGHVALVKQRVLEQPMPEPPQDIALSVEQVVFYGGRYDEVCCEVFGLSRPGASLGLHDIGEPARQRVLGRIAEVERTGSVLREVMDRRERVSNDLRDVEIKLQSTSDDPHVAELIVRSRAVAEKRGALEQEKRGIEGEIQRLQADLAARNRQVEDRMQQRELAGKARQAIKLAQKARRTLDEFVRRLAPEKLALLQHHMDEMYGRLRKPEDQVRSVEIDPETWQVILKDEKGRPLEKRVFSAGMKEMYALSLLWALSKASGRELPIVIDTPVGRLDTTNRRALFEKYLPHAGHQVVVLCTDTEVDVEWAKRLQPFVARQYRLDLDSTTGSAVIRPGFFF